MAYNVITFGAATRDIFVRAPALEIQESSAPDHHVDACFPLGSKIDIQEMIFETGGGATNAAVTFGRLGWKAACVTSVGRDSVARDIAAALKQDDVSSAFFQEDRQQGTGASVIILSGSGERTILVHRGASAAIDARRIPWPKLKAKWFYCSSFGGDLALLRKVMAQAKKVGARVAWNPGNKELAHGFEMLEPYIRQADVFNLNKEEAADLAHLPPSNLAGIIAKLRDLPRRVLVVTDGKEGAYAADTTGTWRSGIIDVPRINVTGAGDSFGSGLVAGLLKKDDIRYALAVGTWNATGVVQQMGAKRGLLKRYPTAKQVAAVPIDPWHA
jgi:sugar/nucleoside kinase (ribokinase family)